MGVYLGQILGLAVGGFLVAPLGWRMTFVVVGLPGVVIALILFLTIREPERGRFDPVPTEEPSLADVLRRLWSLRSFRWLVVGTGIASFAGTGYGVGQGESAKRAKRKLRRRGFPALHAVAFGQFREMFGHNVSVVQIKQEFVHALVAIDRLFFQEFFNIQIFSL